MRVAVNGGQEEQLFAAGPRGSQDASWISPGAAVEFRLYAGDQAGSLLSAVTVRGTAAPPGDVVSASLLPGPSADRDIDEEAKLLAQVMPRFAHAPLYKRFFSLWEEHGFHVTPVHFYQPIPDTRRLGIEDWERESELVGIDMNDDVQLDFLRNAFPRFQKEYDSFPLEPTGDPHEFYFNNGQFGGTDALTLYCMLRHLRPNLVIEAGSGYSTRLALKAAQENGNTKLLCIEPYPTDPGRHDIFREQPAGLELIDKEVQKVEFEVFNRLGPDDVLFIDTSHVVRIGGDVNYLFLEVLPRLNPGVVVHVHDIFLPHEYPRDWALEEYRFWTEQYLLHAFLAYNSAYEVLLANHYLGLKYGALMRQCFPRSPWWGGLSFWMRRVGPIGDPAR